MATEQQLKTLSGFNLRSADALKKIASRLRRISLLQEEFANLRLAGDTATTEAEAAAVLWRIKQATDSLDQLIDGDAGTPSLKDLQNALGAEIVALRTPETPLNDAYLAIKAAVDPNAEETPE